MVDITKLKVGDKVHYIGYKGHEPENGIIKEIPEWSKNEVKVVYYCDGDWNNFMDYTSVLTNIKRLNLGWKH